jgi:hypothetical protein
LVPFTTTLIVCPPSAATSLYVGAVAPEILTPLRVHWNEKLGTGAQVPVTAVRVEPTFAVPEMVGVGALPKVAEATGVVTGTAAAG